MTAHPGGLVALPLQHQTRLQVGQEMSAYPRQDERDRARYLCRDGCLHGLRLYLALGVQQRVIVVPASRVLERGQLVGGNAGLLSCPKLIPATAGRA